MSGEVYDGATWRTITSMEVYDGATWRTVTTAEVYDGAAWRSFYTSGPQITACEGKVCQDTSSGGSCGYVSGCSWDTGEQHRVGWNHSGCVDASHHIAIHCSVGGGSYTEVADVLGCANAETENGCCEFAGTYTGNWQTTFAYNQGGSCTTTYQYRVRLETDGTDTALSTCTESSSHTGCDSACLSL